MTGIGGDDDGNRALHRWPCTVDVRVELLVIGAIKVAIYLGVSQLVIGLTIVALGTSLPRSSRRSLQVSEASETLPLATWLEAICSTFSACSGDQCCFTRWSRGQAQAIAFDIPVMVAVAVICLPDLFREADSSLRRCLSLTYRRFTPFSYPAASNPENKEWLGQVILFAVVLLTVLTLVMSFMQSVRERRTKLSRRVSLSEVAEPVEPSPVDDRES